VLREGLDRLPIAGRRRCCHKVNATNAKAKIIEFSAQKKPEREGFEPSVPVLASTTV
jgi:hypothetical protein